MPTEHHPIVIVGGGLAAGTAVTELRTRGYEGPISLFTAEPHPPYERPPLSKSFLLGDSALEKALVHDLAWYADNSVDLHLATAITAIDPQRHLVNTPDGSAAYSRLLLATGARPRHLDIADRSGAPTTYLRTIEDATALKAELQPERAIGIIGGGWIGLEVAAAARAHGAEVLVLEALEQPLLRVVGEEVGHIFANLHRSHGVDLRTGVTVEDIATTDAGIEVRVDGDTLLVDHLVVGVGAEPASELASAAGLVTTNGVAVDASLRTSDPDILAAGDVADVDHPVLGRRIRTEHWDTAIRHGKVAAAVMLGGDEVADDLPYFFTDQYDLGMEYVGSPGPEGFDRVEIEGDVESLAFKVWWLRGGQVVAGMHVNDWDAINAIRARVGTKY